MQRQNGSFGGRKFPKMTEPDGPIVYQSKAQRLISPDVALEQLFRAAQEQYVYPDSKTFVDLVPRQRIKLLLKLYIVESQASDFDLKQFVAEHFYDLRPTRAVRPETDKSLSARQYVSAIWDELKRSHDRDIGSLIGLPHPYITPGGRFDEQFYWDSYFIMLGLAADDRWPEIYGMLRNFLYLLDRFKMIPTANRSYFLSRSQPPVLSLMADIVSSRRGRGRTLGELLPGLVTEYRFWMAGYRLVEQQPGSASYRRVVKLPRGGVLNRYFDDENTPRPESSREDQATASRAPDRRANKLYTDIRASAESGWDFSSRWLQDERVLESINTTRIVPVDLNCLIYNLETTIAEAYKLAGEHDQASRFGQMADRRRDHILKYFWNKKQQFFVDYDLDQKKPSDKLTLAGIWPLYFKLADQAQADQVAKSIEAKFLKPGGLEASLVYTKQQWDSPNGWAPLQYIAIRALRNYGHTGLADKIRDAWLEMVEKVYATDHKMYEKYDVRRFGKGKGGEYPLQEGFGWTNGVYAVLKDEQQKLKK